MSDQAFMTMMRLLPRSALSHAVGRLTRAKVPASLHQAAIRVFAKRFSVSLGEAEHDVSHFKTFGDFFTRTLKPGARVVDAGEKSLVSPVDAHVSQAGKISGGECIQAKGITFPVDRLLGDTRRALAFENGTYLTLYLSPRDYHRFHCPIDAQVTGYHYLPGEFWPVNAASVRTQDALFAVNERLVTHLESAAGKIAYVAVGATCVSRIVAAYDDIVTHTGGLRKEHTYPMPIRLKKGDEIGKFEMGSTVIMLFEKDRVNFNWDALRPEAPVRFGQKLGEIS
jgi:phosphatidylserine decarboxylase